MKIRCLTNLDLDYNEIWPEELDILPPVGSCIASGNEGVNGSLLRLKVCSITIRRIPDNASAILTGDFKKGEWYAEIELHLPTNFVNISEFELWYEKHKGRISIEEYQRRHKIISNSEDYKCVLRASHINYMPIRNNPESKFRKTICTQLKECNAKVINNPQAVGETKSGSKIFPEPGISDIIVIHRYIGIIFLEFKAASGKLSPVQRNFLLEVNDKAPYSGFVAQEPGLLYYFDGRSNMEVDFFPFDTGKDLIHRIRELKTSG